MFFVPVLRRGPTDSILSFTAPCMQARERLENGWRFATDDDAEKQLSRSLIAWQFLNQVRSQIYCSAVAVSLRKLCSFCAESAQVVHFVGICNCAYGALRFCMPQVTDGRVRR
jgi:hypothetical protein